MFPSGSRHLDGFKIKQTAARTAEVEVTVDPEWTPEKKTAKFRLVAVNSD